jgi:hypothetical protein
MLKENFKTKILKIGHIIINLNIDNIEVLNKLTDKYRNFIKVLSQNSSIPFKMPEESENFFSNNTSKYFKHGDLWIINFKNTGLIIINKKSFKVTGYAYEKSILSSEYNLEDFFHPIFELFRQNNLYPVHSAALEHKGIGFLISGKSGQGKSTLNVDLLSNGFTSLADDRCFLRKNEKTTKFEIIGQYENPRVYINNINHLKSLSEFCLMNKNRKDKLSIDLEKYINLKKNIYSDLKYIIFPFWSPKNKSTIEKLSTSNAIVSFLPLTMICLDKSINKEHFEFLSNVFNNIPSYKIILGHDRKNWSKIILNLFD